MTATSYPALSGPVKPAVVRPALQAPTAPAPAKLYPSGQPLPERAGASTILAENAYDHQYTAQGGEEVYACHKVTLDADGTIQFEKQYALHTVGGVVTECNCKDATCRRRVCKHMVELCVWLATGIRTRSGVFVAAVLTSSLSGPMTVAQQIKAMREDYTAAAARAVILTAAAVEEAERETTPVCRPAVPAPRRSVSGFDPADWK